jgi:hypothetical protein
LAKLNIAEASVSTLPFSTRTPVSPSTIASVIPYIFEPIAGIPQAAASMIVLPNPSRKLGSQ